MDRPIYLHLFKIAYSILFLILMTIYFPPKSYADQVTQRRILAGLDLFPSFLAADRDIENKQTPDKELLLYIVISGMDEITAQIDGHLRNIRQVRGIPVRVEIVSNAEFQNYIGPVPAGIFLIQHVPDINNIIQYSRENSIMIVSPFEGDVERGVMGGVFISDRILPLINMNAVKEAGIRLKSFFLRVAKIYE
ncbi:YfiR/HmsC family protein [Desulfonema limicola]|nr:YfiR/HmsC family protein [Desulfonema limicola]